MVFRQPHHVFSSALVKDFISSLLNFQHFLRKPRSTIYHGIEMLEKKIRKKKEEKKRVHGLETRGVLDEWGQQTLEALPNPNPSR